MAHLRKQENSIDFAVDYLEFPETNPVAAFNFLIAVLGIIGMRNNKLRKS